MSIYFLSHGNRVKIGKSSNPESRVRSLQTGAFIKLRLLAVAEIASDAQSFEIERRLHDQFAWSRQRGEFFTLTKPLREVIAAVAAGMNINDAIAASAKECRQLENKAKRLRGCKAITPPVHENARKRRRREMTEADAYTLCTTIGRAKVLDVCEVEVKQSAQGAFIPFTPVPAEFAGKTVRVVFISTHGSS